MKRKQLQFCNNKRNDTSRAKIPLQRQKKIIKKKKWSADRARVSL